MSGRRPFWSNGPVIDVRTITDEEIPAYVAAMRTGFAGHADEEAIEVARPSIDPDRTLAAFDGRQVVGTARAFASDMTIPGDRTIPVAGVTNVTVLPTHRRRGLLTEMMRQQLDDVVARGEPLAVLIAAEAPIYGRFGYGAAVWRATLRVDSRAAAFAHPVPARTLEMVDLPTMRTVAPSVFEASRAGRPGAVARSEGMWDRRCGVRAAAEELTELRKRFHVVARDDAGTIDGYMSYDHRGEWDGMRPNGTLVVRELCAASPDAAAALWHHALTMDWCVRVEADDRPVDDGLPWLLRDQRQVVTTDVTDFVWVRVLDVPAALSARGYGSTDRLVIEVDDQFRPDLGGRVVLDASPGGATCEPTTEAPDLTLDAAHLGAIYLGGTPLSRIAAAGRVREHTPGAVARADRLFLHSPAPWCSTWF